MKKSLIVTLALATVCLAGVAAVRGTNVTVWQGTGDANEWVGWGGGVVTATATGYDAFPPAGGSIGDFATPDNSLGPVDYVWTIEVDTDISQASFAGTYVEIGMWGGAAVVDGELTLAFDDAGVTTFYTNETPNAPGGEIRTADLAPITGVATMRQTRVGDTITYDYDIGAGFVTLDVVTLTGTDATNGGGDLGWYVFSTAALGPFHFNVATLDFGTTPAGLTITATDGFEEPFSTGTANFDVDFSEAVTGVTAANFSPALGGDAAADMTVVLGGASPNFTAQITGVSGTNGTLGLDFDSTGVTTDSGGLEPASQTAAGYAILPGLPAAGPWALVFVGVMLALAGAVVIRKTAMDR